MSETWVITAIMYLLVHSSDFFLVKKHKPFLSEMKRKKFG